MDKHAQEPTARDRGVVGPTVAPALDQLNLVVRDMARSIEFYRAIGVHISDDSIWRTPTGIHHVQIKMSNGFELELDSEALAKAYNEGWDAPTGYGSRALMSFRFADADEVDGVYQRVRALGYGSSQPPYYTFWGSRYAIVIDPDGNHVGLMSPPDPARRRKPPTI